MMSHEKLRLGHRLDTLVFSGGIGENAPLIRERICAGPDFLRIQVDRARNAGHSPLISPDAGRVRVRVIPADGEITIARAVAQALHLC